MLTSLLHRWLASPQQAFAAEATEAEAEAFPESADAPPAMAGEARPGFRRHVLGHLLLVLVGLFPLVMLVVYLLRSGQGLSTPMALYLFFYTVGYGFCVQQLLYAMRLPATEFVPFNLRSFYGLAELLPVSVLLVPMAIWNLLQSHSGTGLTLSRVSAGMAGGFGQSPLFLGGALWGALGYAVAVGMAGLVVAGLRSFPVPIGNRLLAVPYRLLVGLSTGGAVGFLLGVAILTPLYVAFLGRGMGDPTLDVIVSAFGAARLPDLAVTYGFSCAALIFPLVMLVAGKMGPAGRTVTEDEIRQYYATAVAIPTSPLEPLAPIPPVAVSFAGEGGGDEEVLAASFPYGFMRQEEMTQQVDEDVLAREILAELDSEMKDVINESLSAEEEKTAPQTAAPAPAPARDPRLAAAASKALGPLGEVTVPVEIEFGKATIGLSDWINLMEGQLLKLDKPVSDAVDIFISHRRVGTGQLSQVGDRRAVVVSHIDVEKVLKG